MHHIYKKLSSRQASINLFNSFQKHVCSQKFIKEMSASKMVQQYSWVCFHWWLMKNKITHLGLMAKNNYKACLQQYTREHVYQYGQYFQLPVYSQLKRRSGTLIWSLDDYFLFNFTQKTLHQIIREDLISEEKTNVEMDNLQSEKILNAVEYIQWNVNQLNLNLGQGAKQIKWKYLSQIQTSSKVQTA